MVIGLSMYWKFIWLNFLIVLRESKWNLTENPSPLDQCSKLLLLIKEKSGSQVSYSDSADSGQSLRFCVSDKATSPQTTLWVQRL